MSDVEQLYNLLKESFFLLDDGDRRLFSQHDLSSPRFYALSHIAAEPGLSLSQLSDCMFCDKSNITRIIRGLERDGYLERRPHETDGRSLRLYLTEKGTAVYQTVATAHHASIQARLHQLDQAERQQLETQLNTLNTTLRALLHG
ncbi:MAG: MarR family transcriptional regulator [Anaerolineales bacterium]|nr:MarR family transcriptional regulator [Anaerolineales bacterium]